MTEADCREINEHHTLGGRAVGERVVTMWERDMAVWDGIQVFTGRKADVLNWFRSGQEGLEGRGGFQNAARMRNFQYDMLCSKLLGAGDLEIIRAVLWHAHPTGRYTAPEWADLIEDERLGIDERIVCWARSHGPALDAQAVREFWRLFGKELGPDHILRLDTEYKGFPWPVVYRAEASGAEVSRERLVQLLLALVRREYLSACGGRLVERALRGLAGLSGGRAASGSSSKDVMSAAVDRPPVLRGESTATARGEGGATPSLVHPSARRDEKRPIARRLLEKLFRWDGLGDERSVVMWAGLRPAGFDEETAGDLLRFMCRARVPVNAARAFYAYAATPAFRSGGAQRRRSADLQKSAEPPRVASGPGSYQPGAGGPGGPFVATGWQRHFEKYLKAAFGKQDEGERIAFLAALARHERALSRRLRESPFCRRLREGNVVLRVTEDERRLLDRAWRDFPEALGRIRVAPGSASKATRRGRAGERSPSPGHGLLAVSVEAARPVAHSPASRPSVAP